MPLLFPLEIRITLKHFFSRLTLAQQLLVSGVVVGVASVAEKAEELLSVYRRGDQKFPYVFLENTRPGSLGLRHSLRSCT